MLKSYTNAIIGLGFVNGFNGVSVVRFREAAPLAAPPPAPKGPVEEKSLDLAAFFGDVLGPYGKLT